MMKQWVMVILALLNFRIKLKIILDVIDSSDKKRKFTIITARNSSCGKVMFLQACVIHSVQRWGEGGGVYPSILLAKHRSHDQHYITSCIADQSHLVQGQHTGNIKCIMG